MWVWKSQYCDHSWVMTRLLYHAWFPKPLLTFLKLQYFHNVCSHIWVHWLKNSAITFNLYDKVLYSVASTVVFNNYDWMVWQINTKVEGMYAHTSCRNGKKNGGKCNVTFVKPSSNFWWSYHHKVALRAFWNTALATVNTGLQKVGSNFRINIILAQNWSWESEQRVRAESWSSTSQSDSAVKLSQSWSQSLDSQLRVTAESHSWESELSRTEKWSSEYELGVRDESQSWESELGVRAGSQSWELELRVTAESHSWVGLRSGAESQSWESELRVTAESHSWVRAED